MASMQAKFRSAIGALKDQTSISLAKVASGGMPDLDVALVRATSHEEMPMEERWVQEVLHLASYSRAHVAACVAGIARRLSRTRTWIVALKALMLAHRALREGDPGFEGELKAMGRRGGGGRVLDVSGFRDESEAHGWDYSAFIHAYGRYLEERLGPATAFGRLAASKPRQGHNHRRSFAASSKHYEYSDSAYYYDHDDPESSPKRSSSSAIPAPKPIKEMPPPELLDASLALLRLLDRSLACRPSGLAKSHRLVSIALFPIVRESFLVYLDLRDSLALVLDAFFELDPRDASRAFDLFSKSARLVDDLAAFYGFCKALGVCRSSEYPAVDKIADETLEMMDDFLRDRTAAPRRPPPARSSPRSNSNANGSGAEDQDEDESSYEINGMKALPAPPIPAQQASSSSSSSSSTASVSQQPQPRPTGERNTSENLIDVHDPPLSSEEHENRLALALFSGESTTTTAAAVANTTKWEAFPSASAASSSSSRAEMMNDGNKRPTVSSIGNGGSTTTTTGWELALIEAESEISKPSAAKTEPLAGGFNNLLLDSLYEQAETRQKTMAAVAPVGSASSVAILGHAQSNFLALPAPPSAATALSQDPFAASISVPAPAYVQMSEMRHKQQLLVQEQQQWLQYQQMLHPQAPAYSAILPKYPNNPFGASAFQQPNAYPVSYYGHNPFIR